MKKHLFILVALLAVCWTSVFAQNIDKIISTPPSPPKLVNDYAGVLTEAQTAALEEKLVQYDKSTSTQIAIVIVNSVEGNDIAEVGTEILRKWGVGGKQNNNGVVLLVAFKDRKLNISTGYGLEKSLPDITCQQIIDNTIKPNFKGNDYYGGLDAGADAIIQATQGAYTAPAGHYKNRQDRISPGRIIFIIILVVILLSLFGGGGRGGSFMSRRGYRGFNGPFIFPTGGWSRGGSGWSGGGGGGWSGGGGFGGFGGGGGGGGGASGSW